MADAQGPRPLYENARATGRLARLAFRLLWRAGTHLVVGIVLLLALQALLQPLQLALSRAAIDRAALDLGLAGGADALVSRLPLVGWIALAAAALAVAQLSREAVMTCQAAVGDRLTGYVTEQLILAANRWQGLARFEDPGFADDLLRARTRAATGCLAVLVYGGPAVLEVLTAAALAVVLVSLHPLAPAAIVLSTLPHMAREWEFGFRVGWHLYHQAPEARGLQYVRSLHLMPAPAKDVRLFALGPYLRRWYDQILARTIGTLDRLRRRLTVQVAATGALQGAVAGAVYVYLVWLIARGERTLGDLALYGGAATLLQSNLLWLAGDVGYLPEALGFLPSLFRVLEAPPDLPHPPAGQPARAVPKPVRQGIVFDRVTFSYPGNPRPVLHNLSLRIAPGECVALVGANGAGKTTLVKLLLRLYHPSCTPPEAPRPPGPSGSAQPSGPADPTWPPGRILLDGHDLREYDLDDLRREMSVVFQDFVRYELTAGENIGVGNLDALRDPAHLAEAAAQAGAATLIDGLPQGLDTPLGREFGGRELSGGEWQKLALARAFVRPSQLLVLDEPTAALDVQTEYDVYTRFRDLTRGKMTLLISHRFSTVRMADRILYLAGGRIQEEGSHEALLALGGEYARLYRLQAEQYTRASGERGAEASEAR